MTEYRLTIEPDALATLSSRHAKARAQGHRPAYSATELIGWVVVPLAVRFLTSWDRLDRPGHPDYRHTATEWWTGCGLWLLAGRDPEDGAIDVVRIDVTFGD